MATTCPSREQLEKLLSDQLCMDEEKSLDSHLKACGSCKKALDELTAVVDLPFGIAPASGQSSASAGRDRDNAVVTRLMARPIRSQTADGDTRDRTVPRLPSAPKIDGYEILGKLGHGGMGVVYKARQLDLQRTVALKMVLAGIHAERQSLARFQAEARAVAQLQHPNIVQIYAVGEADGLPYLSLEFVEGGTLAQQVSGTVLSPRRAAELIEVLAGAVQYAHARGVVHRDLKPANVLLTLDGAPKIADFGLAKRLEDHSGGLTPTTAEGLAPGTPRYMSPEQLSPAEGKKRIVGPASDIYALGVILYELLTGRPLYAGDSPLDVLVRVLHEDPTPPHIYRAEVPRDLETICLKCLAKDPRRRYASAKDLAADLQRYLLGQPVLAQPPSLLYRAGKFIRRNKTLVTAALAVAAALTLGIVATSIAALREAHQRGLADDSARKADSARQEAELEAYQARLAAALAALGDHNIGEAAAQLNAVPEERRGWEWHYASSRLDDSIAAFHGLNKPVSYLGGGRLASLSDQGIRLQSAYTGKILTTIRLDTPSRVDAFTTAAGSFFVAEYLNGPVLLLSETGKLLSRLDIPAEGYTHTLAFHPGGSRLARSDRRAGAHEELAVFAVATGKKILRLAAPSGELRSLAYSPDGGLLAGGGDERTVQIWDAATGALLKTLPGHTGYVYGVMFSPDGRSLLSGSADGTFRQWDVATGKLVDERYGHEDPVTAVAYSPDGKWIVSGGGDGTIRFWNAAGGAAQAVLHGHTGSISQVMLSRDGRHVTAVSFDGSVRVFEGPGRGNPRILRGHANFVYSVAFSPDGRLIASGGWDHMVRLWDAVTGLPLAVLPGHDNYVASLAFSPDSRRLVSRSADGTMRVWDTEGTSKNQELNPKKPVLVLNHGYIGMADAPHLVSITPDGARIGCAGDDRLYFWDLETGHEAGTLPLPSKGTRIAAFRPDGKQIACTGAGSDIHLIDAETGEVQATLPGHDGRVFAVNYSPDGSRLVSGAEDREVRIWDTADGRCLKILRGHTGSVFAAVFHQGGSRIASAGRDRTIRIWDTASGAELARLQGHTDYVFSLDFNRDGASLVSGSGDYTVRLWDTFPIARRLQQRPGHDGR
jgi:WD40 repeat protein